MSQWSGSVTSCPQTTQTLFSSGSPWKRLSVPVGPLPGGFPRPAAGLGAGGAAAGLGTPVVEGSVAFDAEPDWEGLAAPWTRRDGSG